MNEKKIKTLIVDDEPEARDLLALLLEKIEGVELTGSAESVDLALEQILIKKPDVVLLDIQMPIKNGFELVRIVHEKQLDISFIFVTAYDAYAIEAIKASAFDYLLKPVDPEELRLSVSRFRKAQKVNKLQLQLGEMLEGLGQTSRIKVNTRTGFILIDPGEVTHCVAAGNYTEVYFINNRRETITNNLGSFMAQLPAGSFFRISRSVMINLNYLTKVDNKSGTCLMNGDSGILLKVARNRRQGLNEVCK